MQTIRKISSCSRVVGGHKAWGGDKFHALQTLCANPLLSKRLISVFRTDLNHIRQLVLAQGFAPQGIVKPALFHIVLPPRAFLLTRHVVYMCAGGNQFQPGFARPAQLLKTA